MRPTVDCQALIFNGLLCQELLIKYFNFILPTCKINVYPIIVCTTHLQNINQIVNISNLDNGMKIQCNELHLFLHFRVRNMKFNNNVIALVFVFILMGWSLLCNSLRPFKNYCAPSNLDITRT